jgi:hypothetical protein
MAKYLVPAWVRTCGDVTVCFARALGIICGAFLVGREIRRMNLQQLSDI